MFIFWLNGELPGVRKNGTSNWKANWAGFREINFLSS